MKRFSHSNGFTLLEVLIALLIFSLGMLGLAGLMVVSVKTNQSAFLRTQASFIAQAMANRIRVNLGHVLDYNGTYIGAGGADPCAAGVSCSNTDIVDRDIWQFREQISTFLPNPTATIDCVGASLGAPANAASAPFNGLCTMSILWSEATLERDSIGAPTPQTFAWVFQP